MIATQFNPEGAAPAAEPAVTSVPSGAETAVPGPSAAPAEPATAAEVPAAKAPTTRRARVEGAMKTALARMKGEQAPDAEQAPGAARASTPSAGGEQPGDGQTTSAAPAALAVPASIVAPAHWPEETRKEFDALPVELRAMYLPFHKQMEGHFTRTMQELNEQRRELQGILPIVERAKSDPRGFIAQFAKDSGIDVWFEQPLPEGEIPIFDTPAEMAKWAAEQAQKKVQRDFEAREQARQKEHQSAQDKQRFYADLQAAATKYPDFVGHKDGIMELLASNNNLSPEQAYQLATWQGLVKLAQDGQAAAKELQALKAQQRAQKSQSMNPGKGNNGAVIPESEKSLPATQRAFLRAQRRMAEGRTQ